MRQLLSLYHRIVNINFLHSDISKNYFLSHEGT